MVASGGIQMGRHLLGLQCNTLPQDLIKTLVHRLDFLVLLPTTRAVHLERNIPDILLALLPVAVLTEAILATVLLTHQATLIVMVASQPILLHPAILHLQYDLGIITMAWLAILLAEAALRSEDEEAGYVALSHNYSC